mmetsp:Transcript_84851/g.274271  ORF Transcript_84851/g.274271 Transcript_84851/m.274271 type:complete len:187 (+) Transcript_84851:213-773(+)
MGHPRTRWSPSTRWLATCRVATFNIGSDDRLARHFTETFTEGFEKTMKFRPRVITQNCGSIGKGKRIMSPESGVFCKGFGEALFMVVCMMELIKANDYHAEVHTTTRSPFFVIGLLIGSKDPLACSSYATFKENFDKTMQLQSCLIKQIRGSLGAIIRIILKSGECYQGPMKLCASTSAVRFVGSR